MKYKFIDIKFLVVKERVQSGLISIEHIGTNSMIADPLTKGLPPRSFMITLLIWVWFLFRICRFSGSLYFRCFLDTFVMDIMDFKVIYCSKVFSFHPL